MSKYLLSLFFLIFTVHAVAASRMQCGAMKSKYVPGRIGYCATLPPSYDAHPGKRFPVLYFLHGLGENEQTLLRSGGWGLIEDLRQQHKVGDFLMAAPEGSLTVPDSSAVVVWPATGIVAASAKQILLNRERIKTSKRNYI